MYRFPITIVTVLICVNTLSCRLCVYMSQVSCYHSNSVHLCEYLVLLIVCLYATGTQCSTLNCKIYNSCIETPELERLDIVKEINLSVHQKRWNLRLAHMHSQTRQLSIATYSNEMKN